MTAKELAATLNGREYRKEITDEEHVQASTSGLLVVFGASDDLIEFRGVINDEQGSCNGGVSLIDPDGPVLLPEEIERDEEEILEKHGVLSAVKLRRSKSIRIEALWGQSSFGHSWTYETETPHECFDILEDGEPFCRGIVIDMKAVSQ